jgi:hypothetical protein
MLQQTTQPRLRSTSAPATLQLSKSPSPISTQRHGAGSTVSDCLSHVAPQLRELATLVPIDFQRAQATAITPLDLNPVACTANQLRRDLQAIPIERRTSNQAKALILANLLLGSFTDIFPTIFALDAVGACSVARMLKFYQHGEAGSACMAAILLAAKAAVPLLATTLKTDDIPEELEILKSAVRPLLPQLSEALQQPVKNLFDGHQKVVARLGSAKACWTDLLKGIAACKTTNEIEALLRDDLLMLLLDNWAERA